jgi:hypothetical protein
MYAEKMKPTIARPKGMRTAVSQMRSFFVTGGPNTADSDHTRRSEQAGELGAFSLASNEPSEIGRQRVPEELSIDRHGIPHRSSDPRWPPGPTHMIAPECLVARSRDVPNGQPQYGPHPRSGSHRQL